MDLSAHRSKTDQVIHTYSGQNSKGIRTRIVSFGCCNELHKPGGLTQHTDPEIRNPRSVSLSWNQGVGRAALPLEPLEETVSLPLLASRAATLGLHLLHL